MIRLPPPRPRARPTGAGRRRNDAAAPPPPRARVLVVDADEGAGAHAVDVIAWDGCEVEQRPALAPRTVDETPDGGTGEGASASRFDIVVVDPADGDAVECIDRLRTQPATGDAEVIFVSGRADVEAAVGALHRGAADWLVKPVAAARLRLAIGRALERRRLLRENERLRHDLALFTGAQRLLQILELPRLGVVAVDVLAAVEGVDAVAVFGAGVQAARGVSADELAALAAHARAPAGGVVAHGADVGIARFGFGRFVDVGGGIGVAVLGATPLRGTSDDAVAFLCRQIAHAVENCSRLRHATEQALRDPLTGLWNANAFAEAVDAAVQHGAPFGVLFIDIDHFKSVNDTHGHLVGSAAIVDVGRAISACVRSEDVVARYGGDEFTVLLAGVDIDDARRVAERVRRAVEALQPHTAPTLRVTVSIGVASWPRHGIDGKALIGAADAAMYAGKAAARNRVCAAPEPAPHR